MKKILTIILILVTFPFFSQTHGMIKHNGEKTELNFIKIENNLIYFSLPGSYEEKKISKYAISQLNNKLKNSSQNITEKIQISTKSDSNKIIVLKQSETIGLNKADSINLFPAIMKGYSSLSKKVGGEHRLKEKAAINGYPFIVIEANNQSEIKGTAYTY